MIGAQFIARALEFAIVFIVLATLLLAMLYGLTWGVVFLLEGVGFNMYLMKLWLRTVPSRTRGLFSGRNKQTRQICNVCGYSGRHEEKLIFCPRCGFMFGMRGPAPDETREEVPPNRPPGV